MADEAAAAFGVPVANRFGSTEGLVGSSEPGGDAIALLYLDAPVPEHVLEELRANPKIDSAKPLRFDVNA